MSADVNTNVGPSKDFGQLGMGNSLTATPYTCQDFIGINNGCVMTLQTTNGNIDSFLHTTQQLSYQIVPAGGSFNENKAITLSGGLAGYDDGERTNPITLGPNDVIYIRFTEGLGSLVFKPSSHTKKNNKVNFLVSGTCFVLKDYNDRSFTNGQPLAGAITGDCVLRDNIYKSKQIFSADSIFKLNSQELDWQNLNHPYRAYTYLKGIEPAPVVFGNVQQLNNQFFS